MSQDEKPFSVSDRRHFTPDGQLRDETADEAPAEPRPESPQVGAPEPAAPAGRTESPAAAAELGPFLLSLGAQAGMLLSGAGQAEGTDPAQALEAARSIISILEMLREKTEGRRTPDEERILEDLLFELRMAYVERRREAKR